MVGLAEHKINCIPKKGNRTATFYGYFDAVRRNDFQMPPTHRLDLGLVWKLNTKKWDSDITFSVYNAYSRRNPFFVFYEQTENEEGETVSFKPTLVSLFPILPAVTYNFKF
jgi:hypothetical protein